MSAITETTITEAIIALMRGPSGTGIADPNLAATVAVRVRPDLARVFGSRVPADLTGDTTFKTLVGNHIAASPAQSDDAQRQALLRAIQTGNVHSADYSAALAAASRAPLGSEFAGRLAAIIAGGEGRYAGSGTIERTLGLSSGYYTAHNLPAEIRAHIDGPRASAAQVADAANFATRIGLDPTRYAGHFVGASTVAKDAIAAHIKSGAQLKDDHVTNMKDARAVIAAVQAGKIKTQDVPPSVQKVMEDMKAKGVDVTDARAVDAYATQNPRALEAARAAVAVNDTARAGLTDAERFQARAANVTRAADAGVTDTPRTRADTPAHAAPVVTAKPQF